MSNLRETSRDYIVSTGISSLLMFIRSDKLAWTLVRCDVRSMELVIIFTINKKEAPYPEASFVVSNL